MGRKLGENEKLLITSNFSFSQSVFKGLVLQTPKKQGLILERVIKKINLKYLEHQWSHFLIIYCANGVYKSVLFPFERFVVCLIVNLNASNKYLSNIMSVNLSLYTNYDCLSSEALSL